MYYNPISFSVTPSIEFHLLVLVLVLVPVLIAILIFILVLSVHSVRYVSFNLTLVISLRCFLSFVLLWFRFNLRSFVSKSLLLYGIQKPHRKTATRTTTSTTNMETWKNSITQKKRFPYILFLSLFPNVPPFGSHMRYANNNENHKQCKWIWYEIQQFWCTHKHTHTHICNTLVIETFSWSWERLKQI